MIVDFGQRTWGEESRHELHSKWWLNSDYARVTMAVDTDKNSIAGIVIGVPSHWSLSNEKAQKAISICGWFVAPDYTGQGLGKLLVSSFDKEVPYLNALAISDAAIYNFKKLGWIGPYQTQFLLSPAPRLLTRYKAENGRKIKSFIVKDQVFPKQLPGLLDEIEKTKPKDQIRRRKTSADWKNYFSVYPNRRQRVCVLFEGNKPLGAFIIRKSDQQSSSLYRKLGLAFVSDIFVNSTDEFILRFLFKNLGAFAPATTGALLLCTSNDAIANAARNARWLSKDSRWIGPKLASKAPLFMLGGEMVSAVPENVCMSFTDSDVDLNL